MKKSDLRTGMWVETRNGQKWIVLLDTEDGDMLNYQEGLGGFIKLHNYEEDLLIEALPEYDVVRIFKTHPCNYLKGVMAIQDCIFDRNTIGNTVSVKINAKIENLEEIKKQVEDLEESLKNLKIKLQF